MPVYRLFAVGLRDASVPAQRALEGYCESILKGSPYPFYLSKQCFCLCNKVFFNGLASQHGAEK